MVFGAITVLGCPGRGARQLEKLPRLIWVTQLGIWHTMVHVPLMFLSEWREFPSAPCLQGKKLDGCSRLHVVEIARVV